jgi:uncharacterized NAD(P)/FAD-binding protein YdhS
MPDKIVIIGAGMAGTAVFAKLIDEIARNELPSLQIDIFEQSGEFGPGLAYGSNSDNLLLNRTTRRMYVFGKHDFLDWVNQKKFAELRYPVEDQFLPRRIFGLFLRDLFNNAINRARSLGCIVNLLDRAVYSVSEEQEYYTLNGKYGAYMHLFACTGNDVAADPYKLRHFSNYYPSPYPVSQFVHFPDGAKVGVIGTRLTAVDLVIELYNRKPTLSFTMLSRTSGLPFSAGLPFASVELTQFCPQNIDKFSRQNGYFSLKSAARLVNKELRLAGVKKGILSVLSSTESGGLSGDATEVCKIREVLLGVSEHLPYAWQLLSPVEQSLFYHRYTTPWVLARLTMPGSNSTKLSHLISCGVLNVTPGISRIGYDVGKGFEVNYQDGSVRYFDYIINSTGIKRHCDDLSTPFVRSLLETGFCTVHPFGGVMIDPQTHFALDRQSQVKTNLTIVGQLAVGNYLMTNSVDGILFQLNRAVAGFVGSFSQLTDMA